LELGYYYSVLVRGAEYCDERVCLSVCLSVRDRIFGTTRPIITRFFMHVTYGRGSVLLCWRRDSLRISGFVDDAIFAHKLRLLDVAARLRQLGSHAALGISIAGNRHMGLLLAVRAYHRPQWAC